MSRTAAEILEDARQLPPDEIDWIVESLLVKGDPEPDAAIEAAWDSEIKRRLDEIDSGAVELVPGEEVRAEMVASLSRKTRVKDALEAAEVPPGGAARDEGRSFLVQTPKRAGRRRLLRRADSRH